LITETLGNLGFDEEIVPAVIDIRKRLLTSAPRVIPARVALLAAPVSAAHVHQREIDFWSAPRYGIDFSLVRTFAANQVRIIELDDAAILAPAAQLLEVDLAAVERPAIGGAARFVVARDGTLHGFGTWFVATLADGIRLSNE